MQIMWSKLARLLARDQTQGSIYHVGDRWLIPTLARTRAGFYLEGEPVEVLSAPPADDLATALLRVQERGNRTVPTPSRNRVPPPVVHGHAGIQTEREFERQARHWALEWSAETVALVPAARAPGGGFLYEAEKAERFTGPDSLLRLAERLIQLIR
ncbi:MAG TPA: hypothetical protein VF142_15040 [Longimicrobium sp.]